MSVKVGINGFGRIGRNILRAGLDRDKFDVVAVNDITDSKTLAHLLKYDSVLGPINAEIRAKKNSIVVNNQEIEVLSVRDPSNLPWDNLGVDIVLECTGLFRDRPSASKHLEAGAKRVIISAPAKNPDITIVIGVNHKAFNPKRHLILSAASCTTNCLAPMALVLMENFGLKRGLMTTIHAYTNDQSLLDMPHKDLRRARAASLSMIPTTTGAAVAVSLVLPELKGRLDGMAIRVPTANVSVVDLVAELEKDVDEEVVNRAFAKAARGKLRGILQYTNEELVSVDFNHNTHSCIFDALTTKCLKKRMVKVLAWYDNEWGYSNRMVDLTFMVSKR